MLWLGTAMIALLLTACAERAADPDADAAADNDIDIFLDIETLQVETPHGTVTASEIPNSFVGDVTDDLYVGIAITEEGTRYGDIADVIVYLCNSDDIAVWLYGDLSEGASVLERSGFRVEIDVADDEITGTVAFGDNDAQSFTAVPADDESGLFYAEAEVDDAELGERSVPVVEQISIGGSHHDAGANDQLVHSICRVGPPCPSGGWIVLSNTHQQGWWGIYEGDDDSDTRW